MKGGRIGSATVRPLLAFRPLIAHGLHRVHCGPAIHRDRKHSQNRDGAAIQAKLDEILRAVDPARDQFVGIEH
jgi:hypothetical protein